MKSSKENNASGFTLIELLVYAAIFSVVGLMAAVTVTGISRTIQTSSAQSELIANLQQLIWSVTSELEMASASDRGLTADALTVTNDGAAVAFDTPGNEVTFQLPLDLQGLNWTAPIQYNFVNEDDNANGILDENEDTNGDGLLTRQLQRVDTDTGNVTVIGDAGELASVQFQVNEDNDILIVTMQASSAVMGSRFKSGTETRTIQAGSQVTRRIYLANRVD